MGKSFEKEFGEFVIEVAEQLERKATAEDLKAAALFEIAKAINYMTWRLGTTNAATPQGGMEIISGSLNKIADALQGISVPHDG